MRDPGIGRDWASAPSAHTDSFARDHLPPLESWPVMDLSGLPELAYPARINAAAELLDVNVAAGRGDRPAVHFSGGCWSYSRLLAESNRIANVLVDDLGLKPGNRVLLRGANHPRIAACWFAVLKAGGVCVTTMPLLRVRELTYIMQKARVRLSLTDSRVAPDCEHAASSIGGDARVVHFNSATAESLDAMLGEKSAEFENVSTAAEDVALIAFTSGTTGQAKGTMHFHRDILAVCDTFSRHVLRPDENDIFCGSPPLAFTYGLGGLLLFPMRAGASTLMLEQASPPHLLQGIEDVGATICFTAPTAYRAMTPLVPQYDISSLQKCVSAGETLPLATFEAWRTATGIRIIDGIGSTEILHIFVSAAGDDIRPGATGKAVPGYQARIMDRDGNDVPPGTIGSLAVRGPTGCRYLDNIERQHAYVKNGWNVPGDTYRMDADGYFWYQARSDDMIISSGYNISGPEIENVLLEHPAVGECGVVGVPDEERGHIVKAYVVLRPGVEGSAALVKELQEFVKNEIAPYKYPRSVEFVSALPRTETGKLQRFRLRDAAREDDPERGGEEERGEGSQPPNTVGGPPPNQGMTDPSPERHRARLVDPPEWPRPVGYANAASATGRLVAVAGQIGWDSGGGQVASDDLAAQVRQALVNVVTVLSAAGAEPRDVVRLTWYLTDKPAYIAARKAIGVAYREVFGRHFPAMSVIFVTALLDDRARVEIEATAVVPDTASG